VYERAGLGPKDVDVVELHDCFTANELLTYEALGLCPEGEAEKLIWDGDNTYGGKPSSPTPRAACSPRATPSAPRAWRSAPSWCGSSAASRQRQVEGARVALQHNLGLGGACVVTMYRRD
jgi:sterol carrier protein 2